jgi:hypothetical protein
MQSPDDPTTRRFSRVLLLGLALALTGASPALAAPPDDTVAVDPSTKARGGDGVGGIEKTPGSAKGPLTPIGGTGPMTLGAVDDQPVGWTDLGAALPGLGTPTLAGTGSGAPGTDIALDLADAKPHAPATLVMGLQSAPLPFKGGTLVPKPMLLLNGLFTSGSGTLHLPATLPGFLPAGTTIFVQVWLLDPAGPQGLAASNALVLLVP